jgi:hypothetical protein
MNFMGMGAVLGDALRVMGDFAQGNIGQGLQDEAKLFQDAMKNCGNNNDDDDKCRHRKHHENPLQMAEQLGEKFLGGQ